MRALSQAGLDVLRTEPATDPTTIAAIGHSFGASSRTRFRAGSPTHRPAGMPPPTGKSRQGLFVLLAIVAVMVVGGGAYALTSGDDDDGNGSPTEIDQVPGVEVPGGEGTGGSAPQEEVGPPTPPTSGVPELDHDLAQGCFEGSMEDCDSLFMQAINIQFENEAAIDYTIYSESCGGRLAATASVNSCGERVPNP